MPKNFCKSYHILFSGYHVIKDHVGCWDATLGDVVLIILVWLGHVTWRYATILFWYVFPPKLVEDWYKVRQLLKKETEDSYYKVITTCDRSFLQSAPGITKCEKSLLQSVSGITKFDRLLLQCASGITKCDRLLLQNSSGITKCDSYYKVRCNTSHSPKNMH